MDEAEGQKGGKTKVSRLEIGIVSHKLNERFLLKYQINAFGPHLFRTSVKSGTDSSQVNIN